MFADRLKALRKDRKMTQVDLAALLGLERSSIAKYEAGFAMPSDDVKIKLADLFGVTIDYLIGHDTVTPEPVAIPNRDTRPYSPSRAMVPIIGSVRCGTGGALAYTDLQGAELADVVDPSEYFYLRAVGDSMEPRIYENDLVLIHIQPTVESGDLGVIVIDEEEGVLKKYVSRDGAIILQSFNPEYPPRVFIGSEKARIRVAGKAVQLVRKW